MAQGLYYAKTEADEVEDMLQLLAFVKEKRPDVEAVSSGAIASDYQRLRVEHVSQLLLNAVKIYWHRTLSCQKLSQNSKADWGPGGILLQKDVKCQEPKVSNHQLRCRFVPGLA